MNDEDFNFWSIKKDKNFTNHELMCNKVLDLSNKLYKNKKISKNLYNNIKKLPCYE